MFRPPTLAGAAIVLIAAGVLLTILLSGSAGTPSTAATPSPDDMGGGTAIDGAPERGLQSGEVIVTAAMTMNVRSLPLQQSEIVAIMPHDRQARVTGRTTDGDWFRIVYPIDSSLEGWIPSRQIVQPPEEGDRDTAAFARVPVIDAQAEIVGESAEGEPADTGPRLPDLTVADASLLPSGRLSVRIANAGSGVFDGSVGLRVMTAEGDILGVLDIEQTTLEPGRSATVDTGVGIEETGLYVTEVDSAGEVEEASEFNNSHRGLLVAGE